MKVVILTRALKMSERVKGILNAQYRVHDMRNVAVLTYNQKHRKTYDTLCLLKANGYQNVCTADDLYQETYAFDQSQTCAEYVDS